MRLRLEKVLRRLPRRHHQVRALTRSTRRSPAPRPEKAQTAHLRHPADSLGHGGTLRRSQDTLSLLEVLRKTWAQRPQGVLYTRPFHVGITLRELTPESEHQATLFGDPGNRKQLSTTMDKLNLKYGHTTLHFAAMLPARETAPTRIAFTQIPVQYGVDYM